MTYYDGYIDNQGDLERICTELQDEKIIAIDMESNGFFRYPEFICLIQVGYQDKQFLVDPIALKNIDPLLALFQDPEHTLLLHSGSYDVTSFKRDYNCSFGHLYDTSIAAAFLGQTKLGLDGVINETLGIDIPKDKSLQRSDWTRRPLNAKQVMYAKADVQYLHELHRIQTDELRKQGRLAWVEEENELSKNIEYKEPTPPEKSFLKAKYVKRLSPRGKSIYREIYIYRDGAALEKGVPPFRVFHNDLILKIAEHCAETLTVPDRSVKLPRPYIEGIKEAIQRGLECEPFTFKSAVPTSRMLKDSQVKRLKKLKNWRNKMGEKLQLAPPLIWQAPHLELLVQCNNRTEAEKSFENSSVRRWQKESFGEDLLTFWESII